MRAPLAVSVGGVHQTRKIASLEFRREAIGGVQSISFKWDGRLLNPPISPLDEVVVYDSRSAEVVAKARASDTGRTAAPSGQQWDVQAFGLAQHSRDKVVPLIYVDQRLTDPYRWVNRVHKGGTWTQSTKPNSTSDTAPECQIFQFPEGSTVASGDEVTARYEGIRETGQLLGRLSLTYDGGSVDTDYKVRIYPDTDGVQGTRLLNDNLGTTATSVAYVVTTDFLSTRNGFDLALGKSAAGSAKPANDNKYCCFYNLVVRAQLVDATGAAITAAASYTHDYVLAHEVVNDLLGRVLNQYDGALAQVDTGGTYQIASLIYPDGVTAGQVLDDLMALEPAFRWYVADGGVFHWEPWPTTVRYEATMEDGGSFPITTSELYSSVLVRWRDIRGRTRSTLRSGACPLLDAAGITRQAQIDAGDEIHDSTGAARLGDNFLADHQYPPNAGTLTVARPIRDVISGRMVHPHEIQPGELIRVRGVESYPDALNASSSDGQTVFRVWSATYNSDTAAATLELDSHSRTTAQALARLQSKRTRKR